MKKDLTCVVQARIANGIDYGYKPGDHRLPNKMILPFAGSNLLEITLKNLLNCKEIDPEKIYLVACEDELVDIAKKLGINVYLRTFKSICKNATDEELYQFVWDLDSTYFMQISPCNPLLRPETIDNAIKKFNNNDYDSLFGVVKRSNYFFDEKSNLVSPFLKDKKLIYTLDTKFVGSIYEASHSIYIWKSEKIKKDLKRWDFIKNDPYLFEIPIEESFDIDYKWQFELAEYFFKKKIKT